MNLKEMETRRLQSKRKRRRCLLQKQKWTRIWDGL